MLYCIPGSCKGYKKWDNSYHMTCDRTLVPCPPICKTCVSPYSDDCDTCHNSVATGVTC